MRQVSLTLNENEFDKFMSLLKSFKSINILREQKIEDESELFALTDEHKKIIDSRIERHLSGESKSYSWEEVKNRARSAVKK